MFIGFRTLTVPQDADDPVSKKQKKDNAWETDAFIELAEKLTNRPTGSSGSNDEFRWDGNHAILVDESEPIRAEDKSAGSQQSEAVGK